MRLIFMGTPAFAVPTLEALYNKGHKIATVFCQPDRPSGRGRSMAFSPVKQKAIELGLSVKQPENLKLLQTVQTISNLEPEALVVVAYGLKLPYDVLTIPKHGAVNLHPSLLPRYRGAAPINHALINGDKVTGISSIMMNERMDAGDIILQQEVPIGPEENAGELEQRLAGLGSDLIVRSLEVLKVGNCELKRQGESQVTYAPKLSSEDGHIVWSQTSLQVQNRIRGVTPRPGAFTLFKGKRLEILKTEIGNRKPETGNRPGTVISVDKNSGPVVRTGDGEITLLQVKPEGKKGMTGAAFVNGYRITSGQSLE
jgi:methionyl-tRNA formyltransferase